MAKKTQVEQVETVPQTIPVATNISAADLANAFIEAINRTKPVEKKTYSTRKPGSPWDPKDGSKKPKLKKSMFQHGIPIDPDFLTSEEIHLLNALKPGRYLSEWVKVYKRKDQGIDIDYPIKTASQRMKLVSQFGVRDFKDLLSKCIEEAKTPKAVVQEDDDN